jgi:energy-converting hydrogenase Eha subunit C
MSKNTNIIYRLVAVALIIIGLLSVIVAWDLLLVTNSHSISVLAMEIGGVVICLGGYFLWKRAKKPGKDTAASEDKTIPTIR